MGSSVFHGGFSTFLAISVLSPSRTYLFMVFYRLWFGIILFGMSNGFLFLPVVLSMVGPTNTAELDDEESSDKEEATTKPKQDKEIVNDSEGPGLLGDSDNTISNYFGPAVAIEEVSSEFEKDELDFDESEILGDSIESDLTETAKP